MEEEIYLFAHQKYEIAESDRSVETIRSILSPSRCSSMNTFVFISRFMFYSVKHSANDKDKFKEDFNKRLIKFSLETLQLSNKLRGDRLFFPILDQLIRSATSIGANVIEAKSSSSKKDYIKFFEIALKSANETKYWLILIRESHKELKDKIDILLLEVNQISKILASSVLTLKGKK